MFDDRERAWDEIHDLLPLGWRVAGAQRDDAAARSAVTAVGPKIGGRRGPQREYLAGEGLEQESALIDLVLKLREQAKGRKLDEIGRRARLAYAQGAEQQSRRSMGRPLTSDELERVVDRAPD